MVATTMSGNSRSREFPGISASNSRPESREWNFPLPIPFPKVGKEFFTLIPVPENGNGILWNFHSRSRYWEWNIKVGKRTFFRDIPYIRQSKSKYMIQHQRIISIAKRCSFSRPTQRFPIPIPIPIPLIAQKHVCPDI